MLFVCLYNEYDDADDDLLLNQMVIPAQRCAHNCCVCKGQKGRAHRRYVGLHGMFHSGPYILHFMICHSNKCHAPRTSSCHKEQRGGTEYG